MRKGAELKIMTPEEEAFMAAEEAAAASTSAKEKTDLHGPIPRSKH
jgi:hypothetical protein